MTPHMLAAVLVLGLAGCQTPNPPYPSSKAEPVRPFLSEAGPHAIEGRVLLTEADAYVLEEPSGRQTRVFFDRLTAKDNIAVGDRVVAHYDGSASSYANSIRHHGSASVAPLASIPAHSQTLEGTLLWQSGSDYVIRDDSGREVRLLADSLTTRDRDLAIGDRVVAITSTSSTLTPTLHVEAIAKR